MPVDETPRPWLLARHLTEVGAGKRAEDHVGNVDDEQSERRDLLVDVSIVKIRVVDGQVPLHGHGEDDAELHHEKEEQDEAAVLAQRLAARPGALHVCRDGDGAHQQGPQEVGHCQTAHKCVKGRFLLLLPRYPQDHDGNDVPHHPEYEHNRGDGGRWESARFCRDVHDCGDAFHLITPSKRPS